MTRKGKQALFSLLAGGSVAGCATTDTPLEAIDRYVELGRFMGDWFVIASIPIDLWFATEVKPRMRGRAFMIRFADDVVMGFENQEDAERVLRVLRKRFAKYGLTLHPDKTRLVPFGRPKGGDAQRPGTFDFLGFTHYWGRSQKGKWVIKRKTARTRLNRGLKRIGEWCRVNRHRPLAEQQAKLTQKLQGHFAYYGITGNGRRLKWYHHQVERIWKSRLSRRSRSGKLTWSRMEQVLDRFPLPPTRIVHQWSRV